MLKRLLILMDETSSSAAARTYSFRLARHIGAGITGFGGVDLTSIEASMPRGIGTSAYKAQLESELRKQAVALRQRLHDVFEAQCKDQSVPFEWLAFEGDPLEALYLAAATHDLAVTGHDAAFCGASRTSPSPLLEKFLSAAPRPLVVCPDELSSHEDVMIAYDESPPAMRTVQMFALLGGWQGRRIHVMSIEESRELAVRRAGSAAGYLRGHGFNVEEHPIDTRTHPAEVLKSEIAGLRVGTLVMGAYGHRGLRELLFGSTTRALIQHPPCALLTYH